MVGRDGAALAAAAAEGDAFALLSITAPTHTGVILVPSHLHNAMWYSVKFKQGTLVWSSLHTHSRTVEASLST